MYISKMILNNFKGFNGKHELDFSEGINFFVGDNNCGKTTIFKAIEFIQSANDKEKYITKGTVNGEVSVEIEFSGNDLEQIISDENLNLKKYQNYIINKNGAKSLRILRSSEDTEIIQGKKPTKLSLKNIRVYNPNSEETDEIKKFENPTGIDKTITALFDAQFVYSDIKHEDYQDFGKAKIVGKLINEITNDFQKETDDEGNLTVWGKFKQSHSDAFGDKGLTQILTSVQNQIESVMCEQYGESGIKFVFGLPEIDNFFKNGTILLSENGVETSVAEKGTGMQRALALSIIQVYATTIKQTCAEVTKPLLFFIDEPETFLHPNAQNKLIESFEKISRTSQVFIATHSPYLLKKYDNNRHSIIIFSKKDSGNTTEKTQITNHFGSSSPTWGEINYYAFGVTSIELHNELYGLLQNRAINIHPNNYKEKEFEKWLASKGIPLLTNKYNRLLEDGTIRQQDKTLPTFIRNIIHHPENTHNSFTDQELSNSIQLLLGIL